MSIAIPVIGAIIIVSPAGYIAMQVRNGWVYKVRMDLLEVDYDLYKKLPSYETMMKKWWIWDAVRFFDYPSEEEEKLAPSRLRKARGDKIVDRYRFKKGLS